MSITYIFIGITVLTSWYGFKQTNVVRQFIMNPYLINTRDQYYRFITSGFIHKDFIHLLWNMISLYFFGAVVETAFKYIFGETLGGVYFVLLYLLGIIVSDVPTYFKQKNNPGYNALGASGGTSSVIFVSIILLPLNKICIYFLCLPGFILGTLYIIYSFYHGRKSSDNINHDAHLYGALFGLVFCVVLYPPAFKNFFLQIAEWDGSLF
ncbi:MAG TPA: rhomboid family intramembrane serine protease [Cyclobacteriaceae bacterium]|nr:rhomboid family intramembrane serine protease [Cyclobacteriaceae bacterium]